MGEEEKEFKVVDKRRFASGEEGGEERAEEKGPDERLKGEGAPGSPVTGAHDEEPLPPADFTTFMISMGASALMHMGDSPDPMTHKVERNLPLAHHTIDTLEMIGEKTKGNLTEEEERVFNDLLMDIKMRYVKATS